MVTCCDYQKSILSYLGRILIEKKDKKSKNNINQYVNLIFFGIMVGRTFNIGVYYERQHTR